MTELSRRTVLAAGAGLAAAAGAATAHAQTAPAPSYDPRPLPFDPASVPGLSERLLTSHHERNYAGAVRRLGAIQGDLAALDPASAPGFRWNGLKREEIMAMNSMILHEIYFGSIGANTGESPGALLGARIESDFGSYDSWAAEFSAMGKAQGGGSGWTLLTWSPRLGRLINSWAADHTMTAADGEVLLALDMYEHAYAMDYGADAGAYVDAFMNALSWEHADARFREAAG